MGRSILWVRGGGGQRLRWLCANVAPGAVKSVWVRCAEGEGEADRVLGDGGERCPRQSQCIGGDREHLTAVKRHMTIIGSEDSGLPPQGAGAFLRRRKRQGPSS
jgi:hypothetical protein